MARHFTKQEIEEIRRQLATYGVRDSEFPEATTVSSEDEVMILQDEKNKRLDVGKIENKIYTKIHDEGIDGKVLSDNNYTTGEKNKLANIQNGAQVNVIEQIKQDGVIRPINNKSVNIDLSDFVHKNLVPAAASPSNKLADKKYVHDEIITSAATFRGTSPKNLTEEQFLAWADTREHDLNDYVYWDTIDDNLIPIYKRYKWDNHEWVFEYVVNNSDFTDAQLAAINSGIDTTHVDKLDDLPTRSGLTAEFAEKQDVIEDLDEIRQNAETGGNAYHLPVSGIPSTDLSEGVNSSLAKAESAIQDVSDKISSDDIDDVIELTQEEFDALATKDPRTLYIVSDSTIESDHVGIASLVQTTVAATDEGINVWTCTLTNNQTFTLQVKNGSKGTSGYSGAAGELEVVNSLDSTDDTAALAASQGKVLDTKITQLGQEVTEIPKVTIPVSVYETGVVQQVEYELGNISIGSGGWVYSASNKRVRTPEGYVLHLYPGDVISLTDYTNARFYASIIYLDNYIHGTGWQTENYTVIREGYACVLVSNLTEVAQTSAEALGSLIRVVRNTTIRKQVQNTEEDVSSIRREFDILIKGGYTQKIEAYKQTHSSADDAIPVTIKSGETIKVTLRQGTGVCNGASVKCRFLNDSLVSQQETDITIGTEATIVSSVNASYVGFYFNKVTTYGTFYADIVVPVDFDVDITTLEQNKGAVVYLLPNTTPPNIDTAARTMTIPSSSMLVFNKNGYLLPNNNVVIDLSGVPSGNKKIVYDNSTQTFLCKSYSAVLTETQGVLALLKTDYEASGNWTVVYNVTASFDVTIDGEGKYPQGDIVGFGSIAVQSKFKEIAHPLTVSQTIFDTTTNSVGIQSFEIYEDRYGIYIINATDSSNSAIQKVGCVIVDLADGTKLGEFILPSTNTRTHGNNMNFGVKYDETDAFPLIYVSATYPPYECDVFRIANDYSSATLIQTITYGGTAHFAVKNSLDWIVGDGCLFGYAAYWDTNSEYIEFVKFTMPDVTQSTEVLADSDVLDSFTVNGLRIAQGAIIRNGKIYIGLGYTQGVEYIKVVDIASRSVVTVVPISYEPEGVSIYKGHLAVSGSGLNFRFRTYTDAF